MRYTLLLILFPVFFIAGCNRPAEAPQPNPKSEPEAPRIQVSAAPVRRMDIAETRVAYGSVTVAPGELRVVSIPYETQVVHVLVSPGQSIKVGDPLVQLRTSASTQLLMQQGKSTVEAAHKELALTRKRYDMKLATNQELNAAQRAVTDAELQLRALSDRGAGSDSILKATVDGLVANVVCQDGQLIATGASMMEIVASTDIEVKLGLEAEDARQLKSGDPVSIVAINQSGKRVQGKVRMVSGRINATSRLVDVFVSLPPSSGSGLMLDAYVRGEWAQSAKNALTVPVAALLPEGDGYKIFTIKDGLAVQHVVKVGLQSESDAQISVPPAKTALLTENEPVITGGNYSLAEGTAVGGGEVKLGDWIRRHSRSTMFLVVVLAVAGALSGLQLPVGLFPQVSFPRTRISLDAGDRPAEQMAIEVTTPVEEAVRAIPGVREVRSTTTRGTAEISVSFEWGDDMTQAMLQVESEVNKCLPALPAGTRFSVERMDPTVFPVIAYSLTSETLSLTQLRDIALFTLRPALNAVPGVARIGVQGGETEEFSVVVDTEKLQSHGLALSDVTTALTAANVLSAVGKLEQANRLYLVIADTRFQKPEEIAQTVLRSSKDGVVLLRDVATVTRSTEPQWIRVTAAGRDAVLIQVYQQPGGNTVQIAHAIGQKLDELKRQLPAGARVAQWYDQSTLITASTASTGEAIVIGVGFAAVVLMVFLRNWRITLIAIVTVPCVIAMTVLLLSIMKMSFNIMTLGGIAAAVGLIIDDAIVMCEHIVRRVHGASERAPGSAGTAGAGIGHQILDAAEEFKRPLAASSAATIIIFAPLAFLSGVTGAFFTALSLTIAASLIISFVIAWVAVPLLSLHLLSAKDAEEEKEGFISRIIRRMYVGTMKLLLAWPVLLLLFVIPLLGAGYYCLSNVSSGFMPSMDEGGFILDYKAPPGTSLTETNRLLTEVEKIITAIAEVSTYSRRTGLGLGGGINEPNSGDFFVRLKPLPRRPIDEVMQDIRTSLEEKMPTLKVEVLQLMEDLIGDLTSVPQPIEIKIFSDDTSLLGTLAESVSEKISHVPGVTEINNGITPAGDALNLHVDRVKASLEGVDADAVTQAVTTFLTGKVATSVQQGPKLVGIRVSVPSGQRKDQRELGNMLLRAPDGHLFPLKRVATFTVESGQPQITRADLKRMVAVTARITGRDLGSTVDDVKAVLDKPGVIPPGASYVLGGLYEQQQIAFRALSIILAVDAALVFLLLLFLYESFRVAISILLTVLLAVSGVYIGLWITGTEFNITSRMGMTMIIGIVTEVAIFYYSEYLELPPSPDRFILAGVNRMRPIAMTTFASILALAPLAFGIGEGSAMQQPLAVAIISGLIFQLPLVLIALPVFLSLGTSRKRGASETATPPVTASALNGT